MPYDLTLRFLARIWIIEGKLQTAAAVAALPTEFAGALLRGVSQFQASTGDIQPALQTSSQGWSIALSTTTADVTWQPTVHGEALEPISLSAFTERAGKNLADIARVVGSPSVRLALVTEGLVRSASDTDLRAVTERLLRYPPTFSPCPWEWDWRCVSTVDRQLGQRKEPTNTIAAVKRAKVRAPEEGEEEFDALRVDFDINTSGEDDSARFGPEEIVEFFSAAAHWHEDLSREVLSFMRG